MAGANYQAVHEFCKDLSLCPSGHGVRRVALLICLLPLVAEENCNERSPQ
jgi:hypothetical protein